VLKRELLDTPEAINAKWLVRKGERSSEIAKKRPLDDVDK
jgi:hypothetical protein